MSHHPKIHPVHDPEAPHANPTASLVPRGASRSEHGDPPNQRSAPLAPPKKRQRRNSCCCRCVCYTLSILLLLIVVLGATIGILYLVFKPKLLDYSIDRLTLARFTLNQDSSLSTAFNVTLGIAFPQVLPNFIRSVLCALTVAEETGFAYGVPELMELFSVTISKTSGTFSIYPNLNWNLVYVFPEKDSGWMDKYFFFRIKKSSVGDMHEFIGHNWVATCVKSLRF
ncbi:unnamed protein product [Cochlearia groenlandica]